MYDYSFRLDWEPNYEPDDVFMDILDSHFSDEDFEKPLDFDFAPDTVPECPYILDEDYWNWLFSLEEIYGNQFLS